MTYLQINWINSGAWKQQVILDGSAYYIECFYNETKNFWSMNLYDSENTLIIAGFKLVPNYNLLLRHTDEGLPQGNLYCFADNDETPTYETFVKNEARLIYESIQ